MYYYILTRVSSATSCDSCGARAVPNANGTTPTPFSPSRYLCIDCSDEEVDHSIDLCGTCFADRKSATRGDVVHSPRTHNVLQLRTTRLRVYRHAILSAGASASRRASELVNSGLQLHVHALALSALAEGKGKGAFCVECKEQIKGPPFWCCIDCRGKSGFHRLFDMYDERVKLIAIRTTTDPAFVCYECNRRVERKKPWLIQWLANPDYQNTHDWSHTLVSIPDPDPPCGPESDVAEPGSESSTGMGERLARLEEKLDRQSADLTSRLATLEKLLERLLGAGR